MKIQRPERTIQESELKEGQVVPKGYTVLSAKGAPICGALKKNSSGRCHSWPMENGRCQMHGGKTPIGIAAGVNMRSGRQSRSLPARLVARYEEMVSDPDILNLQSEVALVDTRLHEILGRLDSNESGAAWRGARLAFNDLQRAMAAEDSGQVHAAMRSLSDFIEVGLSDMAIWQEAYAAMDTRRRLVESEQKRLVAMNQIVTTDQALTLVAAMVSIFKQHVTDPAALRAGQQAFSDLLTRPNVSQLT